MRCGFSGRQRAEEVWRDPVFALLLKTFKIDEQSVTSMRWPKHEVCHSLDSETPHHAFCSYRRTQNQPDTPIGQSKVFRIALI